MLLTPTLSRAPETDPGLDQQQLNAIGLDYVRSLSRRIWTDHNLHDPGITTLELLCYALTDLSYRAQFPIADLLATPEDNAANMAAQFFTPRQILPNRALTVRDYRKLLIDLPGVKNAWIQPAALSYYADVINGVLLHDDPHLPGSHEVPIKGLYSVLLEFMDEVTTQEERDHIVATAQTVLQANRNLCEDFVAVAQVQDQAYSLCAELDLTPDADPAQVVAQIRFAVERYLAPPVLNSTLAEMLARVHDDGTPYTVAEIFEGPLLANGFIDDAELDAAELRSEIRLSDVISVIMDVPGVLAVRAIEINQLANDGSAIAPDDPWRLAVPAGKQPRLSDTHQRLVCYKRKVPLAVDATRVQTLLAALEDAERTKLETPNAEDLPIPLGRFRDPARYRSFQQHFPVVYGLSDQGLPVTADAARQAQALQLKAYLLFFDQAMANYFAQLANVRALFSRDPALTQTYFAQRVDSFPDATRVYADGITTDDLAALLEDSDAALARRNRFLDHLLSRFAEDFHHYVSLMASAFGVGPASAAATKCAFLAELPQIGADRGLAYDYALQTSDALWNSWNVSGLERRIARLLGIANFSRRNLGEVAYDMYTEIDSTPGNEYRWRIKHPVSNKILLSASKHYVTADDAHTEMEQAVLRAQMAEGYQRKTTADGKFYFNIVDATGEVIGRRIEYFASSDAMEAAIETLMTVLREYYSGEGMYLIENILLRPEQDGDPFMPICVDPGCSDCADADPYSYRVHFVLPAYAGRFHNMDFRRFVEEVIRQETPAHILPKVCWVNADDMARVESAYRDWIPLRAGVTTADRATKIQALIDALYAAKNVYPPQPLRDCGQSPDKPPFILGRTALGSEDLPS